MQERERRVGPTQIPIFNRTASPTQTKISTSQSPTKVNFPLFCFFKFKNYFFRHYHHHVLKIMNQH
jgi:hypothetical protein